MELQSEIKKLTRWITVAERAPLTARLASQIAAAHHYRAWLFSRLYVQGLVVRCAP